MFQYMFARRLQEKVQNCEVDGYDMPMWGMKKRLDVKLPKYCISIRLGHLFPVDKLIKYLESGENTCIDFGGLAQRVEYYGSASFMRTMFPETCAPNAPSFGDDRLVINVRAAEILKSFHPDYVPAPIAWYQSIVKASGLRPIFMGQLRDDWYSQKLRDTFPNAEFLESHGPAMDFETIRNSTNIAIGVSSFSWLAAWLSPKAQVIHMPLLGMFNPLQRIDVDLMPKRDSRYRFYQFPVCRWRASQEDIDFVLSPDSRGYEIKVSDKDGIPAFCA